MYLCNGGVKVIGKEKYKNIILYFLHKTNNVHLGKTKLMKLIYFLDFDHFEKYSVSVTGDSYCNLRAGPVPDRASLILEEMKKEGLIDISTKQVNNIRKYEYTPLVSPNIDIFKITEINMLKEVCKKWEHHSTAEIVNASHGEEPWIATREGENIPYALAFYRRKFDVPDFDDDKDNICSTSTEYALV